MPSTPRTARASRLPSGVRDRVRGLRRHLPAPLVRQVDVRLGATPAVPTKAELERQLNELVRSTGRLDRLWVTERAG